MLQHYLQSIANLDYSVLDCASDAPSDLPEAISTYWSKMSEASQDLAARLLGEINNAVTTALLLRLLGRAESLDVRSSIFQGLQQATTPPMGDDCLRYLETVDDSFEREVLYILAAKGNASLEALRSFARHEEDEDVQLRALIAAAALQGGREKIQLFGRLKEARADEVMDFLELVPMVKERLLAKALLPWLADETPITRLHSDYKPEMLMKKDAAILLALELGIKIPVPNTDWQNFPPPTFVQAKLIFSDLPNLPKAEQNAEDAQG